MPQQQVQPVCSTRAPTGPGFDEPVDRTMPPDAPAAVFAFAVVTSMGPPTPPAAVAGPADSNAYLRSRKHTNSTRSTTE